MKASKQQRQLLPNRSPHARLPITLLMLFGSLIPLTAQQPPAANHANTTPAVSGQDRISDRDQGPVLSSSEITQGAMLLHFGLAAGGLHLQSSGRGAFEIAGADHVWFPAEAHLVNGVVVVSTSLVPQPTAVRYQWSSTKTAALFNDANLPAQPFQIGK